MNTFFECIKLRSDFIQMINNIKYLDTLAH